MRREHLGIQEREWAAVGMREGSEGQTREGASEDKGSGREDESEGEW